MSLHHERQRAQHGHPLHRDHTEDLETGIASAVREIDEMRAALDRAEATLARVRKTATRYASARPQWDRLPHVSSDIAEGMNTAGEAILRVLEGDQQ